jgi:4-hydroxybenzoate polyprenyltransferase
MAEEFPAGKNIPYERHWVGESKVKAIIAMIHSMAVIIFSLLTGILVLLTPAENLNPLIVVSLVLAMAAIQASIGVFNDIFDWKLDKAYKPWRAIPAGAISPRWAVVMASVLLFLGLLIAAAISFPSMILLLLGAGTGILYSARLKRTYFSWLPYVVDYPSLPVWVLVSLNRFDPCILIIYLLAGPFALAVHLCNQMRDFEQDEVMGMRGLVQHLGRERAISLCVVLFLLSPVSFLIMVGYSGQPVDFLIMLSLSIIHWVLTVPLSIKPAERMGPTNFRSLFRRLQISGPLMLVAWYWIFTSTQ